MKNQHQNLHRQISDLIPIIELCLPLIKEVDKTQGKLKSLPVELEQLTKYADLLNLKPSLEKPKNSADYNLRSPIEAAECKLDSIVDDLEGVLVYLTNLDLKLKNLLALKERLEALQEERIDGITPEHIYKLLEKQQSQKARDKDAFLPNKAHFLQRFWQKIFNHKHFKKIALATVITTGITLYFGAIYYSTIKYQAIENKTVEENKNIN